MSDAEFAPTFNVIAARQAEHIEGELPRSAVRAVAGIRRRATAAMLLTFAAAILSGIYLMSLVRAGTRPIVLLPHAVSILTCVVGAGIYMWYSRQAGGLEHLPDSEQLVQFAAARRRLFAGLTMLTVFTWVALIGVSFVFGVIAALGQVEAP